MKQAELTSEGLLYFFGYRNEITEEKKLLGTRTNTVAGDSYHVVFDTETEESEVLEIELENNKKINMSTFTILSNGGVQIAGLTQKEKGGIDGAFAVTFDNEFVEINNQVHTFESEFVLQNKS